MHFLRIECYFWLRHSYIAWLGAKKSGVEARGKVTSFTFGSFSHSLTLVYLCKVQWALPNA